MKDCFFGRLLALFSWLKGFFFSQKANLKRRPLLLDHKILLKLESLYTCLLKWEIGLQINPIINCWQLLNLNCPKKSWGNITYGFICLIRPIELIFTQRVSIDVFYFIRRAVQAHRCPSSIEIVSVFKHCIFFHNHSFSSAEFWRGIWIYIFLLGKLSCLFWCFVQFGSPWKGVGFV